MRIAMLSQNESQHDSRVIREAQSLAAEGHQIIVVCRAPLDSTLTRSDADGVTYIAIPRTTLHPASLAALFRFHIEVLRLDAAGERPAVEHATRMLKIVTVVMAASIAVLVAIPAWLTRRLRRLARRGRAMDEKRRGTLLLLAYIEALSYLNDYARSCTNSVTALRPDVIHAHDLVTLSAAVHAARATGARLVYDAHELETHTNYPFTFILRRWVALYESALIRRCDAVITVCDSIANWLARDYAIPQPTVVMNAPRREAGARLSGGVRAAAGVENGAPLAIYVGSVTIDRGLEITVRTLPLLPSLHLATVGPRYGPTEQAMRAAASELGVSDRLHFVDPVAPEDVVAFISDADVSVIPIQNVCLSYAFSFPNKLLESVYAGVPVAAADLVEIRAFLEKHRVGLIMDETDQRSIASTIDAVLRRRAELAPDEAELDRIDTEYGWSTQAERLAARYAELDASSPGPTGLRAGRTANLAS